MKIIVDKEKCTGCKICVRVCPQKVLELRDGKSFCADIARCMGCFGCEDECPVSAIRVLRARPGENEIEIEPPLNIDKCDVAVVGAGPAGMGAAITCAKAGLDVVVFERLPNRKLSHHTDAGLLVGLPDVAGIKVDENKITFPELDISIKSDFSRKCESIGLLGPDGLSTKNELPADMELYTGNKDKLVRELINEAEKAGAKIWFNAKVANVLKENGRVTGIELESGEKIKAEISVISDGIMAKISKKAGFEIHKNIWYANILSYEWKNSGNIPSHLLYINGDMKYDPDVPAIFGAISITDAIHLTVMTLSDKKFNPSDKPIDFFVEKFKKDKRVTEVISPEILNSPPDMLNGCRVAFRDKPNKNIVLPGAVSVGDAWVDDGELGNTGSLANGVHAGRTIVEAFEKKDFSTRALESANNFITDKLLKMLQKNKAMKLIETELNEEELKQMFKIMQHMNFPVMLAGKTWQQFTMFTGFMFKNFFNFFRYRKVFKKLM